MGHRAGPKIAFVRVPDPRYPQTHPASFFSGRVTNHTMNAPVSELLESKGSEVYTVPVTATVHQAVQKMIDARIGSVLVVDGEALVGIFTERDVLVRIVGANRNPMKTPVSFVMTHNPVSVDSSTTIQEVVEQHSGKDFRHLPVVDQGRLLGMVSMRDIVRWIAQPSAAPGTSSLAT
jgi:CBS domain-containing protein